MTRGNRDRYGKRHRRDSDYGMGESKPGDVGDSNGTFHDRARQNENVIVDGAVRSVESHQRSSVEAETDNSHSSNSTSHSSADTVSQDEAAGKVVTLTVDSSSGTRDTMAEYKNHHVHIEGGTPGKKIRVRLEKGEGFLIGRRVSTHE